MDMATQVQTHNEGVYILHSVNTLVEGMHPSILPLTMSK